MPFFLTRLGRATSFVHKGRFFVICSVAFFSYLTGIILPFQSLQEGAVLGESIRRQSPRVVEAKKMFQVVDEDIHYKKAVARVLAVETKKPDGEWGVAKQIGEHTWTMTVASDEKVGTAQEIFQALNAYRQRQGVGALSWDTNLGNFAQGRADAFLKNGTTDAHAGFNDFLNNQDGFKKSGFMALGENSSFGYHIEGVHLIEWVYAGDAPHNNNQLNRDWTHVGIGVAGLATDLVFGGRKM